MRGKIVGDPSLLAIESGITEAYVGGVKYGVCEPDATMLANAFDEVERRIAFRGPHKASFAADAEAGEIADAYRNAVYAEEQREKYFGIPLRQFLDLINDKHLVWAPDGDEAFDDGSYVIQFEVAVPVHREWERLCEQTPG